MKYNLSKIEDRKKFRLDQENQLILDLRKAGLMLSENAVAKVGNLSVDVGVNYQKREGFKMDFASEVTIYLDEEKASFSVGTTGSFEPLESDEKANYWRIVHGSEIVRDWSNVVSIVRRRFDEVNKLYDIAVVKD